jgi:hypothetical protein
MGTYFNPPESLPDVARHIEGETYDELVSQLKDDEILLGHYQRLDFGFQNAPWLKDSREFDEFERQAREGYVKRLGFYAGTRSLIF